MKVSCHLSLSGLFPSTSYHKALLDFIHCHSWLKSIPEAFALSDWLRTWGKKGL